MNEFVDETKGKEWLDYARDTEGLGNKGIKNVNIAVQCDIKVAASHYRQLQRHAIDLRLENESLKKLELQMAERINRLINEKADVMNAFKKISTQSFTAYQILQKDRQAAAQK